MIQFKMIITFETRVSSVDVRAKESVTLNHASAMQTGSVARSVLSACFFTFYEEAISSQYRNVSRRNRRWFRERDSNRLVKLSVD